MRRTPTTLAQPANQVEPGASGGVAPRIPLPGPDLAICPHESPQASKRAGRQAGRWWNRREFQAVREKMRRDPFKGREGGLSGTTDGGESQSQSWRRSGAGPRPAAGEGLKGRARGSWPGRAGPGVAASFPPSRRPGRRGTKRRACRCRCRCHRAGPGHGRAVPRPRLARPAALGRVAR